VACPARLLALWIRSYLDVRWSSKQVVYLRQADARRVRGAAGRHGSVLHSTMDSKYPYDPIEDALHSFTATAMGFAFALGVVLTYLQRGKDRLGRLIDLIAIIAAVAIPLAMSASPDWEGLFQRVMFAIAYIWYGAELLRQPSLPAA